CGRWRASPAASKGPRDDSIDSRYPSNGSARENLSLEGSGRGGALHPRQVVEGLRQVGGSRLQRGEQRVEGRVLLREARRQVLHLLGELTALLRQSVL